MALLPPQQALSLSLQASSSHVGKDPASRRCQDTGQTAQAQISNLSEAKHQETKNYLSCKGATGPSAPFQGIPIGFHFFPHLTVVSLKRRTTEVIF